MRKLYVYFILFLISSTLLAQDYQLIDKEEIRTYVEVLASDSLEGRYTGASGQKKAADYLAKEYEKIGLQTFTDKNYFETFELQSSSWGSIYIKKEKQVFFNNDKISYLGFKEEPNEVNVELIFGGHGTKQELNSIKVKDRFVLIFTDNIRASYKISDELKIRGAKGVLLANVKNENHFQSIKKTEGRYLLRKRVKIPDENTEPYSNNFHRFAISNELIKVLMNTTIKKLKTHIKNETIQDINYQKISLKVNRRIETIKTENVVGILQGNSDTTIYISAHYDHIGKSKYGIYNGADDNASGTAALLELAEFFSKLEKRRYRMVFLAATAEELGLIGSYIHVTSDNFDANKALLNFNIDMISRVDRNLEDEGFVNKNYLYAIGTDLYPEYKKYLEIANREYKHVEFDYRLNNGSKIPWIYTASDHANFHDLNIPAIMFFTGLHNDYHRVTDTPEKIDYELLRNRITLIAHTIYHLQKID